MGRSLPPKTTINPSVRFFNFIKNSVDPDFQNPCDNHALRKLFKAGKFTQFKILEKDVVDEIIFRTQNSWNRIMLELMARGCMRVGEVLKLTPMDIDDRKAIIRAPKSGREAEPVFLPQKLADRLKEYIREKEIESDARIFPITYSAARLIVKKAGNMVGIHLRPHDLRRHAATWNIGVMHIQRQHLLERFFPGDQSDPGQVAPGALKGASVHGQPFHDGLVAVVAEAHPVADGDQEQVQGRRGVGAGFDMAVTDQPVIEPAELLRHLAEPFGQDWGFGCHADLLCCGVKG